MTANIIKAMTVTVGISRVAARFPFWTFETLVLRNTDFAAPSAENHR